MAPLNANNSPENPDERRFEILSDTFGHSAESHFPNTPHHDSDQIVVEDITVRDLFSSAEAYELAGDAARQTVELARDQRTITSRIKVMRDDRLSA